MASRSDVGPAIGVDPVLRVGVTGHRALADEAAVGAAARSIFNALTAELERVSPSLPRPAHLRIVSPLADGADRVVAEAALAAGATLQAPLPFSRATYEDDFGQASTAAFRNLLQRAERVFELNGDRAQPEAAYEAVGRVVLGHSDVLIAVWNGQAARGRGGTGQIVEEALTLGVPVVWLRPDGLTPPEVLLSTVQRQQSAPLSALTQLIAEVLSMPLRAEDEGTTLTAFGAERRPAWTLGNLFILFRNVVLGRPAVPPVRVPDWEANSQARWSGELASLPEGVSAPLMGWLRPISTWADELATYYGGLYRSVFLNNFLLSVLGSAVSISTLFMGVWTSGYSGWWNNGSTAFEVAAAAVIVFLAIRARQRQWHARWIDYRELAERLRPLRFTYLLGSGSRREPRDEENSGGDAWIDWIVPDVERSLGLPNAEVTPAYLAEVRGFLLAEIDGQIGYHRSNTERMETMERRLGKFGELMFWLILVGGLLNLALNLNPLDLHFPWSPHQPDAGANDPNVAYLLGPLFQFLGVVLPGLGAALFGIRALGEFSRLAKRSSGTAEALRRHRDAIASVPEAQLSREALAKAATDAANLMMSETADWRTLVVMRPIDMPG